MQIIEHFLTIVRQIELLEYILIAVKESGVKVREHFATL
jgi:hypothetical protein